MAERKRPVSQALQSEGPGDNHHASDLKEASEATLKRMKRQQSLTDFFNKKPNMESVVSELALDATKQSQAQPLQFAESSKMNENDLNTTCKVFKTVYGLAKRCRPFSDIESVIELQIANGIDMGTGLHSCKTAVKIADFIVKEIKTEMFTSIIEHNLKICLIIDEESTIACKPVVIVFVKVEDSEDPPTIFVELVELEKQDAETMYTSVMESLNNVGFTKNYLEKI